MAYQYNQYRDNSTRPINMSSGRNNNPMLEKAEELANTCLQLGVVRAFNSF